MLEGLGSAAGAGALSRSVLSFSSCNSEPSALLPPCTTLAATLLGAPCVAGALPGAQHDAVPPNPQPPWPVVHRLHGDLDSTLRFADVRQARCKQKTIRMSSIFRAMQRANLDFLWRSGKRRVKKDKPQAQNAMHEMIH